MSKFPCLCDQRACQSSGICKETMQITEKKLSQMFPQSIDKLPGPAEHNGNKVRWVGFAWIVEGPADGTEPLKIVPTTKS